jgi:hypothetical protein
MPQVCPNYRQAEYQRWPGCFLIQPENELDSLAVKPGMTDQVAQARTCPLRQA